jgi:type I restriction enzyme R subunit
MIDAEASDLFDVLRYIAFTKVPLKRAERAAARRADILSGYDPKQATFLDFVLSQYVAEGEEELQPGKLPDLLELKYGSPADALHELGKVEEVRRAFRGFQQELYRRD